MATITTDTFLDGGVARTAGEGWTMNGGVLTIRTDTRWHANAPAGMTGSFSSMAISSTLGGGILIDGRNVREVWFNSGSGTVPAIGTTITQGGVSGYLLGVYSNLAQAPTAVGASMPSEGFIKFREVTGGSFAAGALTGIGATALGADRVSWIEVVMDQSTAITVPRLGFFRTRGEWYELLETTNGTAGQLVQLPTNGGGAGTHVPAVWIETAPGSNTYEAFPCVPSAWINPTNLGTDERAKFCLSVGLGQIGIGTDGSNNVGFVPPAGCKIRIPNILGRQTSAANRAANLVPNATLGTRPDFTTTAAGSIDIEYFLNDWYLLFSAASSVTIKHSATFDACISSNIANPQLLSNIVVSPYTGTGIAITLTDNTTGGLIENCKFIRGSASANGHAASITGCLDYQINECFYGTLQYARSTQRSVSLTRCQRVNLDGVYQFNCNIQANTCFDSTYKNIDHCDRYAGDTNATTGIPVITVTAACNNIMVDGITFGLKGVLAGFHNSYSSLAVVSQSFNVTVRNAGTPTVPLAVASATLGPQYVAHDSGANSNVRFQRMYVEHSRTTSFFGTNTSKGVVFDNIRGTVGAMQHNSVNATVRSARATSYTTTGQSAVYGSHFMSIFTGDTTGRIVFSMNEATVETASQVQLALTTAAGGFTSAGNVSLPAVGDSLTMTMPYFAKGHTALANLAPIFTGTGVPNHAFEFDIDTGAGFSGTFQAASAANLSAVTISPTTGFRLRLRATCTTAAASNLITYYAIQTVTTATAQNELYDLEQTNITLLDVKAGARVQIYDLTNDVELFNGVTTSTTLNVTVPFLGDFNARLRIMYATASTADQFIEFTDTIKLAGFTRAIASLVDSVYVANAIDGFSVTGITIDDTALLVEVDDGQLSWGDIYAYETAWLTTEEGIRDEGRFITAIDPANYLFENFKIKNVSSPSEPLVITGGWGRDSVTNETLTLIDTTGGTIFSNPDLVVSFATGSGLSPAQDATLSKLDTLTENVSGLRFTAKALEEAPSSGGGGGGGGGGGSLTAADVWTYSTRTLTTTIPTAAQNATAVRSELATELARVDVATSTRLATAGYTTPPTAASIRSEIDANSTKLDVAVGTRLASSSYVAPANSDVAAIKAKTDNLPADPASEGTVSSRSSQASVNAIPTNPLLTTDSRLNTLDANISTRLASSSYTAPANADIAAIKAKTDELPADTEAELASIKKNTDLIPGAL
jgi:hypothetical protein